MNRRFLIVTCLTVGSFVAAGGAATTEENFETLFGDDVRKAARTATAKDDAELANAFLKACGMLADEPDLKVLLYQKAAEFGSKDPVGHAAALKAVVAYRQALLLAKTYRRSRMSEIYAMK